MVNNGPETVHNGLKWSTKNTYWSKIIHKGPKLFLWFKTVKILVQNDSQWSKIIHKPRFKKVLKKVKNTNKIIMIIEKFEEICMSFDM